MRRNISMLAAVLATTVGIAATVAPPPHQAAAKDLKGAWTAESLQRGGKTAPAEVLKSVRMTFTDTSLTIAGYFGPEEEVVKYSVDSKVTPHQLDLVPANGEKVPGVYELRDGKLTIALPAKGSSERPKVLTSPEGSTHLLFVMRKAG